jgi:4-methyl-5(b-hydroxyethyl)-thiazole monophosphate biosynthesis
VKADRLLFDVLDDLFDMVVLPGGLPGSEHLKKSSIVEKFVRSHFEEGHFIGAICAAPMALGAFGILQNKKATCYPGFESHLKGAEIQNTAVCVDGKVITSQGPATSPVFAFELLKLLGEEKSADGLRDGMLYSRVLK